MNIMDLKTIVQNKNLELFKNQDFSNEYTWKFIFSDIIQSEWIEGLDFLLINNIYQYDNISTDLNNIDNLDIFKMIVKYNENQSTKYESKIFVNFLRKKKYKHFEILFENYNHINKKLIESLLINTFSFLKKDKENFLENLLENLIIKHNINSQNFEKDLKEHIEKINKKNKVQNF